jgi:hypothetical protein
LNGFLSGFDFLGIKIAIVIGIESLTSGSNPIPISIPIAIWIDYPTQSVAPAGPGQKNSPLAGAGEEANS